MFNEHRAFGEARRKGNAIVVEGYLDAIAVFSAGSRNVVATLGTAFTEGQIARLWRMAPEPLICFDGDAAGKRAAFRAIDRILPLLAIGAHSALSFCRMGRTPMT